MTKNDSASSNSPEPHLPVAVVSVTYSPGRHLPALMDSFDSATDAGVYVVLSDNGSTDGVPQQAAREHDNVEFLPTGGNIGYGAAINVAARRMDQLRRDGVVRGDYFVITNPDVEFLPGSIDEMLLCLDKNPQAGAVGPRIEEADGTAYPSAREVPNLVTGVGHAVLGTIWPGNPFTRAYKKGTAMDAERAAGWLSGACLAVRWDAFDQIGGFDERYFMYLEDVDFGDRLRRAGWTNIYCPSAKIRHDQGHSANKHSGVTLPAHHASAYRFQADRHPHAWQVPLRLVLWLGLKLRGLVAVGQARASQRTTQA